MNSRACQSQTRLRKRYFSNKVSSDHLTCALYYCIPLFSFPGRQKSRFFLSWTPCRCLISVKNSQKNCESTTRSWKNRALQEAIPCLWAIIHRHILSSNSSRLDASNMGKHVQVGKMHQFFWDKSTMKEWKANHGNLMLCQVYQTQKYQAYLLSSPSPNCQQKII